MRMQRRARVCVATMMAVWGAMSAVRLPAQGKTHHCKAAVLEGEVRAGESFRKVFAPGYEFFLEPLRSGWLVRVLEVRSGVERREAHDLAEVATPPYRSVSPLLISTDWAFRAQDAAAWNPREFRWAADRTSFLRLAEDEERIAKGSDAAAEQDLARRVMQQPEGTLRLLDVALVPGTHDQSRMAAAVASHLATTPHEVVQGVTPSALGELRRIRFRVELHLGAGMGVAKDVAEREISCSVQPTP